MIDVVSNERIRSYLSPQIAYTAVKQSFLDLADGTVLDEPRHRMPIGDGTFNVMWASSQRLGTIALKAYPVIQSSVRQAASIHISLYSKSTGQLEGVLRGDALGQIRTGAASVVVAKYMANPAPRTLTVFGTGFQARGQLDAFLHHFPTIKEVFIVARNPDSARSLTTDIRNEYPDLSIELGSAEESVRKANLIVTATGSSEPLFDGDWLRPGVHVSAIGSNHAKAREIDAQTLKRCSAMVVDSRATALGESGDLIMNSYDPSTAYEVADLIGDRVGRMNSQDITLFISHGLAVQDLYAADAVMSSIQSASKDSAPSPQLSLRVNEAKPNRERK